MNLIERVNATANRSVERSADVSTEEFADILAGRYNNKTKSGVYVGATRAQGIPPWFSGVRYLSESVGFLPIHTYRDTTASGRVRRADPAWLKQPDVEVPTAAAFEFGMMSLLHRGNAYFFKLRNQVSQVNGLRPIHPDRVRVGQAQDGTKIFKIDQIDIGFTRREILHVPGLSYNGLTGLDPISIHAESLGLIAATDEHAARTFGQGTHLQAYLSLPQPLKPEEAELLKESWKKFHEGVSKTGEFGVIGNGAEYKTISLTPEQNQLLETRQFNILTISQLLRIPPHKLYDLSRATFSNIEQQSIDSVTDSLRPWCLRFESYLNSDPDLLPAGNFIEFKLEGLLRGDTKTRYESYGLAIQNGFMMPSEPRRLENLPDIDGTEYLNRALNMIQIGPDAITRIDPISSKVGVPALTQAQIFTINEARADYGLPPLPDGDRLLTFDEIEKLKAVQSNEQAPT